MSGVESPTVYQIIFRKLTKVADSCTLYVLDVCVKCMSSDEAAINVLANLSSWRKMGPAKIQTAKTVCDGKAVRCHGNHRVKVGCVPLEVKEL